MTNISLPRKLAESTFDRIKTKLGLIEVPGQDGGPLMTLRSPASPSPVGQLRVLNGRPLQKVVAIDLVVPAFGLDSHMIFAFTPPESAVPHFTVDAVQAGDSYAFHLDLIPRVDLGSSLAYMTSVFEPLTDTWRAATKLAGLTPAQLSPRQLALMSPWMLAYRANAEAFAAITGPVTSYLDRWFALIEKGIPDEALKDVDRAGIPARDQRNRAAIFNPEVDPVWAQVDRLVGGEVSAKLREVLKG